MTSAFVAKAAVALAACLSPTLAYAAPAPAPIRSMTFEVEFSSRTEERVHTSGLAQRDSLTGAVTGTGGGSGVRTLAATTPVTKGTIVVDVIAVTGDGLVVDVTETAERRGTPKARIGITIKGKLVYDAVKTTLNEEEVLLLQLLNRALVEGHDADGATWTDDLSDRGFKDVTTYRILSSTEARPGPVLHMELERAVSSSTAGHPFEITATAKFDYNEQRAAPLSVTLRERRTNTLATGQQQQADSVYTYKLVADTAARG